jgi:hypothetical protein
MNNLFSTRYVRNISNSDSTSPFLIITDAQGKVAYANAVDTKKLHKIPIIV